MSDSLSPPDDMTKYAMVMTRNKGAENQYVMTIPGFVEALVNKLADDIESGKTWLRYRDALGELHLVNIAAFDDVVFKVWRGT